MAERIIYYAITDETEQPCPSRPVSPANERTA